MTGRRQPWRPAADLGLVALVVAAAIYHQPIIRLLARAPAAELGDQVRGERTLRYDFGEMSDEWHAPSPWRSRVITGELDLAVEHSPELEESVLRVKSQDAHYIIWDQSRTFDPEEYPSLRWSWKAIALPTGGDVRTHKRFYFSPANKNDKALQILIGFEGERVLMYAWDSTAPVGTEVMERSPVADIATRIVDSGDPTPGLWRSQDINIYEDYIRRFGETPGLVLGISIQTNSNHTSSMSEGLVSPILVRGLQE